MWWEKQRAESGEEKGEFQVYDFRFQISDFGFVICDLRNVKSKTCQSGK